MKQTLELWNDENPLEVNRVSLDVPKGVKILSKESYAEELFNLYQGIQTQSKTKSLDSEPELISAKIVSVSKNQAILEWDGKESICIPLKRDKDRKDVMQAFENDSELVVKVKSRKSGVIEGDIIEAIKDSKINEIIDSIGKPIAYAGKVKEMLTSAGYVVEVDGVNTFMPGSLAGINKLWDFESIIGKTIYVMPVNYSKEKGTIVVSHRDYLKTMIPTRISELEDRIGDELEGFVTGCSKQGVFVEFNECLTGLIQLADLEQDRDDFLNGHIQPGRKIKFRVKFVINEDKISLTQKEIVNEFLEWSNNHKVGEILSGTIEKKTQIGFIVNVENDIKGILHFSSIPSGTYLEEGAQIDVEIKKIDKMKSKLILKMK